MTSAIAQLWTSSNYSFKLLGYRNSLPQKQPFYYAVSGSAHKAPTYSSRCVSGIPMYRSLQSQQRSDQLGSAQRTRYHSEDLELPFHEMSRCKSPSVYHYLILRLFCLSVASTVQGSNSMNLTTSPTNTPDCKSFFQIIEPTNVDMVSRKVDGTKLANSVVFSWCDGKRSSIESEERLQAVC